MEAPDKVYLQEGCSVPVVGFVGPAWNNPKDKENTVEYIRKDTLVKWAEETYLSENASAIRKVCFKQLVEKLNEM